MAKNLLHNIQGNGLTMGVPTISISGNSSNGLNNINIFSFAEENQKLYKKYEIYESTEDLLALSCAWYRVRVETSKNNKGIGISKLLDRQLFSAVTEEDKELATKIRDYYSKKIMMLKLKNEHMSKFTQDLNNFIHSEGTKFVEEMFGLVYRLPQFYFYDTKIDDVFFDKNKEVQKGLIGKEVKQLTYIDKTVVDRRTCKRNEYWFTDEKNNVVTLLLSKDNPLTTVWEQLIKNTISLEGLYYSKKMYGREYYQVEKYNLA